MELGISIFGALVLVFLLLTFLSAVFAISIVLALTVGIFFTFSFLIQNIEEVKIGKFSCKIGEFYKGFGFTIFAPDKTLLSRGDKKTKEEIYLIATK